MPGETHEVIRSPRSGGVQDCSCFVFSTSLSCLVLNVQSDPSFTFPRTLWYCVLKIIKPKCSSP